MYNFLRKIVAPELVEALQVLVPKNLGYRLGRSQRRQSRNPLMRKYHARMNEARRLKATTAVLPPAQGHRRAQFCGTDDLFWTASDGTITSQLVKPRRSIWSQFRSVA